MTQYVGLVLVKQSVAMADAGDWPHIQKEYLKKFEQRPTLVAALAEAKAQFDLMNERFKKAKEWDVNQDTDCHWDGSDYFEEPLLYAVSPLD